MPSTHQIQGNCIAMQSSIWFAIWRKLLIYAYISSLLLAKALSVTVMQTSQDCGHLHQWTPVLPNHEVVGSSSMQDALYLGPPNFNPKLHSPLLRLSTLQCHELYVTSFLSWGYCRKWGIKISRFFLLSPTCIEKSLKTIQAAQTGKASLTSP